MPRYCSVLQCNSNSAMMNLKKIKFFSFPGIRDRRGRTLPEGVLRRAKWIRALHRADFTDSKLQHARICSKHFHFGYPNDNPEHQDYVPSLNMGYEATNLNRRGRKVPLSAPFPNVNQEESTLGTSSNDLMTKFPNLHEQLVSFITLRSQNEIDIKMDVFIDEESNHHEVSVKTEPVEHVLTNSNCTDAADSLQLLESPIAINKDISNSADTATTRIPPSTLSSTSEINNKDCTSKYASWESVYKNILKKQPVRRKRKKRATKRAPRDENDEFGSYVATTLANIKSEYYRTQLKNDISKLLQRSVRCDEDLSEKYYIALRTLRVLQEHSYSLVSAYLSAPQ